MSILKILHFLADGRVGGPQVRIVRVHQAMNESIGCSVETVVACPPVQPADHFARSGIRNVAMEWNKPKAEHPLRSGLAWLISGLWKDVAACRKIMRMFPDSIVHVNGAILLSAAIAAILERRKWVWHFNDTVVPRWFVDLVKAVLFLGKGQVIATSQAVIEHYRLLKNTPVIYPPAPVCNCIAKRGDVQRIGTMANFSPSKSFEYIIDAFSIIANRYPDLSLEIAGRMLENKRWYYEKLRDQVIELSLEHRIKFVGFVEDPVAWLSSLDVFVFSSQSESAGLVLIEAMACGVPIISGEIPATREILDVNGLLVPLRDEKAIAAAIIELAENSELRHRLSKQSVERAREVFSATVIARKYCEVYLELLKTEA